MGPVVRLSVLSVIFAVSVAFVQADYEDDVAAITIEADDECLSTREGACTLSALQIQKSTVASSSNSAANGLVSQDSQSNTKAGTRGGHCTGGFGCNNMPLSLCFGSCHWVTPAPAPTPGAHGSIIVTVGTSHDNNRKCVTRPYAAHCARDAANRGHRVNTDYPDSPDEFEVKDEGEQICVRRTDSNKGWGENLEIRCHVGGNHNNHHHHHEKVITIGTSSGDRKCVNPHHLVSCPEDAGNRGHKANTDYADANDRFEITVNSELEICAQRVDKKGGWLQDLQIRCRER